MAGTESCYLKQSINYNILYFRHVIFGVAGIESCHMKKPLDYNILYFRHVVFGVAGTESCYMKQSMIIIFYVLDMLYS